MKKLILIAVLSLVSSLSLGQTKTGVLGCLLVGPEASFKNKVDIVQNVDGTGGVAEVSVEGMGIKCGATGASKFGSKELFSVEITTQSGEVIKSSIHGEDKGLLWYGKGISCACMILDPK